SSDLPPRELLCGGRQGGRGSAGIAPRSRVIADVIGYDGWTSLHHHFRMLLTNMVMTLFFPTMFLPHGLGSQDDGPATQPYRGPMRRQGHAHDGAATGHCACAGRLRGSSGRRGTVSPVRLDRQPDFDLDRL